MEEHTSFFDPRLQTPRNTAAQIVTIFDSGRPPFTLNLASFNKTSVSFGRDPANDIVLESQLVSRAKHGEFILSNGMWYICDTKSTNGIICNEARIQSRAIADGDLYRIDGTQAVAPGVLFVISSSGSSDKWQSMPVGGGISIGRSQDCNIILPHISVSLHHAIVAPDGVGGFCVIDTNSTNGVIVNGKRIQGRVPLHEKDVITITNSLLIFSGQSVHYTGVMRNGISVDTRDVVILRKQRGKQFVTCQQVSLDIHPGELVSIIGGSGAGKSTVLNAMCGYLSPASGAVYINGIDLYRNFDSLKKIIGYVPQSDIVYDNLTLYDMLSYAAKLRLPPDVSSQDREAAITRAIATVELNDKRDALIGNLSGGQRKRASIAVELLSDPNLLFLDEPASGLDPGTERSLMHSLRQMADKGKTVILVTHSTLQLQLCDKIVFMGKGGYLCFCGSYREALQFFGVNDIVDVYNMITSDAKLWAERYKQQSIHSPLTRTPIEGVVRKKESMLKQFGVLCSRYFKLIFNDKQRLIMLMAQAPLLAVLISLVADGEQFEQYETTKSLLFALSCCAFWIGMLNAIQEICKERTILKREYMTGLRLSSYILSKLTVLGVLCAIQSLMLSGVFCLLVGMPEDGVIMPVFAEMYITTFLTALASVGMGLFVSSLFKNPDRAMTVAPILLLPQILFCGIIFKLEGASEYISYIAVCRFSMESYGTIANLNDLELKMQVEKPDMASMIPHDAESFFKYTPEHLVSSWLILIIYTIVFIVVSWAALQSIKDDNA